MFVQPGFAMAQQAQHQPAIAAIPEQDPAVFGTGPKQATAFDPSGPHQPCLKRDMRDDATGVEVEQCAVVEPQYTVVANSNCTA